MHSIQKYELLNLRCDFIIKHKGGILMITKENELWFLKKKNKIFFSIRRSIEFHSSF